MNSIKQYENIEEVYINTYLYDLKQLNIEEEKDKEYHKERRNHNSKRDIMNIYDMNNIHDNDINNIYE